MTWLEKKDFNQVGKFGKLLGFSEKKVMANIKNQFSDILCNQSRKKRKLFFIQSQKTEVFVNYTERIFH